jgi:predicted HicB family RNase H-like nuclease
MSHPTKPKKVGRPKLPKGEAKGKIVPVRFGPDDLKKVTAAAKASKQNLSEWIRGTLKGAVEG